MTDFSEDEQLEAYEEAYTKAGRGGQGGAVGGAKGIGGAGHTSRRGRVVERQLEALRWLQGLVTQDPKPGDSVAAWLNPSMAARRLERAGLPTLSVLVERVNGRGARWWVKIPGMGTLKALRILDWLRSNEDLLGLRVRLHADKPRAQLTPGGTGRGGPRGHRHPPVREARAARRTRWQYRALSRLARQVSPSGGERP
jgi:hypothetical protein